MRRTFLDVAHEKIGYLEDEDNVVQEWVTLVNNDNLFYHRDEQNTFAYLRDKLMDYLEGITEQMPNPDRVYRAALTIEWLDNIYREERSEHCKTLAKIKEITEKP